jgi:hypothetical protein
MKSTLYTILVSSILLVQTLDAQAGELNIEAGGTIGAARGSGGLTEDTIPLIGFSGTFGWFTKKWLIGITTRGSFAPKSETKLTTPEQSLIGAVGARRIHYGPTFRYYFLDDKYIQLEANVASLEVIHANRHLNPKLPANNDRFFVRGYSLRISHGIELKENTQFVRVGYEYERYRSVNIVKTVYGIGNEASTAYLHSSAHVHVLTLSFGFTKIF